MPVTEPVHRVLLVHPLTHLRLHPLQLLDRVQDAPPHRSTVEVVLVEQLISALSSGKGGALAVALDHELRCTPDVGVGDHGVRC